MEMVLYVRTPESQYSHRKVCILIHFTGVRISQVLLAFRHMGLCVLNIRTYWRHQNELLFPAIITQWYRHRAALVESVKGIKEVDWSGDARFDSMGHYAKFGAYTLFCNTISKIVHFELVQV